MKHYVVYDRWGGLPVRRFFTYRGAMRWWRRQILRGLYEIRHERKL